MKWISGNILFGVSLLVVCNLCFSKQGHVIPNAETALNYHGKSRGKVYIRVASFSHESNAKNYQIFLKNKIHSPVVMAHKKHYYTVDIGPLHNAADVRKIAANFLTEPKKVSAQHYKAPQLLADVNTVQTVKSLMPIPTEPKAESLKPVTTQHNTAEVVAPAKAAGTDSLFMRLRSQVSSFSRGDSPGFFLSAGGGEQFYRVSGNNYLNTGSGWPLDRYVTDSISNQPYFFLSSGYTVARPQEWLPYYSLGLLYTYAHTATVSGYVDQYSLPAFRNYNFQYDIQFMNVLATLKADIYRWQNFMPYLLVGLGAANYSATNYNEQALGGVTPRVNPAFGSNAGTNFSSSVGLGVDYVLRKNIWLNAEFNYTNYGKIQTGYGANYSTDTGTNYDNEFLGNSIFATSVLVGVTYYPE